MSSAIDTFTATIQVGTTAQADAAHDDLSDMINHRLPAMFAAFDHLAPIQIDRLVVDLGQVTSADLITRAESALAQALHHHLQAHGAARAHATAPITTRVSGTTSDGGTPPTLVALSHMLRTGRRHLDVPATNLFDLLAPVAPAQVAAVTQILQQTADQPQVVDRLRRQLRTDQIAALLPDLRDTISKMIDAATGTSPVAQGRQDPASAPQSAPGTAAVPGNTQNEPGTPTATPRHHTDQTAHPSKASNAPSAGAAPLRTPAGMAPPEPTKGATAARESQALLTRLLNGTFTPADWQKIAATDMLHWWQSQFGQRLDQTLKLVDHHLGHTPAATIAARLAGVLPAASIASILAARAPTYGGLIGYLVTAVGWGPRTDALTIAAIDLVLSAPKMPPQTALETLIAKAADALAMSASDLSADIGRLVQGAAAHPGQTALQDMLTQHQARLPHPQRPASQPAAFADRFQPVWAYLQAGQGQPNADLASLARAALATSARQPIIALLMRHPAAVLRMNALIGEAETKTILPHLADSGPARPMLQKTPQDRPNTLLVDAGGLVILWPFLEHYLKQLGIWTAQDGFRDPQAQRRAVLLLHGLATDTYMACEPDLTMEKLLIGMESAMPTDLSLEVTPNEQKVTRSLLDAVRQHWDVLQGSSNETLQATFLQRSGKLSHPVTDGPLTLTPHNGPYDMLLDRLPWQISLIKLPWMREVLHVSWR